MKLAITAQGENPDSEIDQRFGRAKGFIIYDIDSGEHSYIDNSQNLNAAQGAGIQAAKIVMDSGIKALITGHVGPKAFTTLNAGSIEVYTGAEGTVLEAIEQYKKGELHKAQKADVDSHW